MQRYLHAIKIQQSNKDSSSSMTFFDQAKKARAISKTLSVSKKLWKQNIDSRDSRDKIQMIFDNCSAFKFLQSII